MPETQRAMGTSGGMRHERPGAPHLMQERQSTFRGYAHDYGVRGNAASLAACCAHVERLRDPWRHRRSHTHRYPWQGCKDVLKQCAMARPRMTEPARSRPVTTCDEAACASASRRRARCGHSARRKLCGSGQVPGRPTAMELNPSSTSSPSDMVQCLQDHFEERML